MCDAKIVQVSLSHIDCLKKQICITLPFWFFLTGLLAFITNTGLAFSFWNIYLTEQVGEIFQSQDEAYAVSERQCGDSLLPLGMRKYDLKEAFLSTFCPAHNSSIVVVWEGAHPPSCLNMDSLFFVKTCLKRTCEYARKQQDSLINRMHTIRFGTSQSLCCTIQRTPENGSFHLLLPVTVCIM